MNSIYGIKTVKINGEYLFVIRLKLAKTPLVTELIKSLPDDIICDTVSTKTGKEMIEIKQITLSYDKHQNVASELGSILKAHAQAKLDDKYFWV